MEDVIVVGGGIGGLGTALALGRAGHRVTVLERDVLPMSEDPEEAFGAERSGAPQSHQTHGFLARIVVELKHRFPDVLEDLRAAGCATMPTTAALGDPRPGDEDLAVLIVRRTTFEWVLRRAAAAEANVELRVGVPVAGLLGGDGVVTGVRLTDGTELTADVVVASTGRRGDVPGWLAALDVDIPETIHESGLMYLSHWYRLPEDASRELDPKSAGDLGFVKYMGVPGDGDTLSVTLAIRPDDKELRAALSTETGFERACRILPGPDKFFADGSLEPLGGVRPMTGLLNRLRRFLDEDGKPRVVGFHAIGDAHTCTNPLYGRGCSLAFAQAGLLADAMAAHPGDPAARAIAYEAACAVQIEPWHDVSVQMDKAGADPESGLASVRPGPERAVGRGSTRNEENARPTEAGNTGGPGKAIAAVFAAAATDPVIGRGIVKFFNMLATPAELMADAELVERVMAVAADPDAHPVPPAVGPTRGELLAALSDTEEPFLVH